MAKRTGKTHVFVVPFFEISNNQNLSVRYSGLQRVRTRYSLHSRYTLIQHLSSSVIEQPMTNTFEGVGLHEIPRKPTLILQL